MLTPEEIVWRSDKVGASDASRIMAGKWAQLWRLKKGLEKIDVTIDMDIGTATEHLHQRRWAQKGPASQEGLLVKPDYGNGNPLSHVHPTNERIIAKLDWLTVVHGFPVESKWHGYFMDDEDLVQKYYWQVQHQLMVTGAPYGYLTILRPGKWSYERINEDQADQAKLFEAINAFLWHLDSDEEPDDASTIVAPPRDQTIVYDMSKDNNFYDMAYTLACNEEASKLHDAAKAGLRESFPDDAHVALIRDVGFKGNGVTVTRRRDGGLIVKVGPVPEKHAKKAVAYRASQLPTDEKSY